MGVLRVAVKDKRRKIKGVQSNFLAYYEVDQEESYHALSLDSYGQGGASSWVLLECEI